MIIADGLDINSNYAYSYHLGVIMEDTCSFRGAIANDGVVNLTITIILTQH